MERRARTPDSPLALLVFVVVQLVSCTGEFARNRLPLNIDSVAVSQKNGRCYRDEKPFTGSLFRLNDHADTVFLYQYRNGREHGIQKVWYFKGRLQEVRLFNNGEKEGRHVGYWKNGKKRFEYLFERDLFNGIQKEWHANGRRFKHMQYRAGYEQGLQQIWDTDGAIIANYEARNGRNYGNIGRKNCRSVWQNDSVRVAAE
ncbi:toxin-antitoxin system YwqK family antitoxin [Larkinella terrae]|uniref:Toxin-antitoxin system YwqK family antitoxin n=1 Tax=Larkinella terrae TaxID=2025311 RepID=A0A7K0EPC9_9BACT|nr:toxin-antitoxin system YwqK family antitoxin [Larkinella terrae]MRS63582.1 toxin-antitoxin system YwqK family antitoxin [Larkinella terrae]